MSLGDNIKAKRSELKLSQEYVAEKFGVEEQENKWRVQRHNSKMICGRWLGYIFLITGYSGYAGYYNTGLSSNYWIIVLIFGITLLLVTSVNYFKKAQMKLLQFVAGLILICSVFLLPAVIPLRNGLNVLVGHIIAFAMIAILNLKFWRHTWSKQ